MIYILVEDDPYLRMIPAILDPTTPDDRRAAISDFVNHDVDDFAGWCRSIQHASPAIFPAKVEFAYDQDDLRAKLPLAEGLIIEKLAVGEAELALAPQLAGIVKFGTIMANVDADACSRHGVALASQARRVNVAVAEHAFALMIALAKRLCETAGIVDEGALRAAGYDPTPYDRRYTTNSNFGRIPSLKTLNGSVFGAIGMGEIGRNVARRAHAFAMTVLYYQRQRMSVSEEEEYGAQFVSMAELLENSDFLSLHLPLDAGTKGIIDANALRMVKRGAILVNVARAQLVEREALLETLTCGHLGGYGLDVGYDEPAKPDEPLLRFKNVMLTPHTAVAGRENGLLDLFDVFTKLSCALTSKPTLRA